MDVAQIKSDYHPNNCKTGIRQKVFPRLLQTPKEKGKTNKSFPNCVKVILTLSTNFKTESKKNRFEVFSQKPFCVSVSKIRAECPSVQFRQTHFASGF